MSEDKPEQPESQSSESQSESQSSGPPEESVSGIDDGQLPHDLRPGEENPLASPLDEVEVDRDLEMDRSQDDLDEVRSDGPAATVAESEQSEQSGDTGIPQDPDGSATRSEDSEDA